MKRKVEMFFSQDVTDEQMSRVKSQIFDYTAVGKMFVYYRSLEDDFEAIRFIHEGNKDTISTFAERDNLHETITSFVEMNAYEEDKERILEVLNPEYYKKALNNKKRESLYYRWLSDDGNFYFFRLEIYKVEPADEVPKTIIIGCEQMDAEFKQEFEKKEFQISLFEGLSMEYTSVWLVRPNKILELYKVPSGPAGMLNGVKKLEVLKWTRLLQYTARNVLLKKTEPV